MCSEILHGRCHCSRKKRMRWHREDQFSSSVVDFSFYLEIIKCLTCDFLFSCWRSPLRSQRENTPFYDTFLLS